MHVDHGYYMSVVFLVTYCFQLGSSLKCYSCNSTDTIGTDECKQNVVQCAVDAKFPENRCLKTIARTHDSKMDITYTITYTGCVPSRKDGCEETTNPAGGYYIECYCNRNKCNGHAPLSASTGLLFLTSGLMAMLLWKREQ